MDIRKVKKLIELLEESGISELEISEGEESVRISRHPRQACSRQRWHAPLVHQRRAAAGGGHAGDLGRRAQTPQRRAHGHLADGRHVLLGRLARARNPSSRSAAKSRSARSCASSKP